LFAIYGGNLFCSDHDGAIWQKLPQFFDLTWRVIYSFFSKGDTIFVGASAPVGMYY